MERGIRFKSSGKTAQAAGLGLLLLLAACSKPVQGVKTPEPDLSFNTLYDEGQEAYTQNCAMCHSDGTGSESTPPAIGSPVLSGPVAPVIRIVLHGQRNVTVINGTLFKGVMPGLAYMTDREIAAAVTYMRKEFAEKTEPVQPAEVAAVRGGP